jgi:hypothetical protein
LKKILVPLTLSRESHAAQPVAIHFAQACNATVVRLHVVQRGFVEGGTEAAWALPLSESCLPAVGDGHKFTSRFKLNSVNIWLN